MAKAVKLADIAETSWSQHSNSVQGTVRTKRRQRGSSGKDPQHCGGTGLSAAVSGKKKSEPEELQYRYSDL